MINKYIKIISVTVLATCMLLLIVMSQTKVKLTQGNIYQEIIIPGVSRLTFSKGIDEHDVSTQPSLENIQGPIIYKESGRYRVTWYCINQTYTEFISEQNANSIEINCNNKTHLYNVASSSIKKYDPNPDKIAVISDLEGDLNYFLSWGKDVGVLDNQGNWAFGSGHIVILGDVFNRGRYIYDLVWKIYHLEQQAEAAGGQVHFVLGNHEHSALSGNTKYAETEHVWAMEELTSYKTALANDNVIGQWIRQKPVILLLGDSLFVHGGISKEVVDSKLSLAQLNQLSKALLNNQKVQPNADSLLFGMSSITWYRGYFRSHKQYPKATTTLVAETLRHFGAKRIIVGHSQVENITALYDDQVYAIDSTRSSKGTMIIHNKHRNNTENSTNSRTV